MSERERSPYRSAPRTELVVGAGPSSSLVVVLFVALAASYALWWSLGWLEATPWLPGMLAVLVSTLAAGYTLRRNRWRFTLERQHLRVERLLPAGAKRLGTLDVSGGLRLRVDVPERGTTLEARLTLSASGEEIAFYPGAGTRRVHDQLARLLRESEVHVDTAELPRLPGDKLGLPGG